MASPPVEDLYALLGIGAGADDAELRVAWRRLAACWHPDRAGHASTERFQQLSAAYAVLSDPLARAAYDRRFRAAQPAGAQPSGPAAARRTPPPPARPPAPAIMLRRHCGALVTLLACGTARFDESGYITLVLRESEAAQGGMASISMPVELRCPQCAGRKQSASCPRCRGSGTIEQLFSAWIAVPPGAIAGEVLAPTVELPDMLEPVRFRVELSAAK